MTNQNFKNIWEAEKSNSEACNRLRKALREVQDPEIGLDMIQLGLIRDVQIKNDGATIVMILTNPYCPFAPAMFKAVQVKAEKTLGMPIKMEFGKEIWDQSMMEVENGLNWGLY